MTFNEFNKEDLDFTSLITKPADKPKLPRPSEGLRFLNRNLKKDYELRKTNLTPIPPALANTSVSENSTKTQPTEQPIDKIDTVTRTINVSNLSIDKDDTIKHVSETSIDDTNTTIVVSKSSIDKNQIQAASDVHANTNTDFGSQFGQTNGLEDGSSSNRGAKTKFDALDTELNTNTKQDSPVFRNKDDRTINKSHITSIDENDTDKAPTVSSIDNIDTHNTKPTLSIDDFDTDIPKNDASVYSTKFKSNFTKLSNHFFSAWKDLSKTEKLLFLYFYRNSFGWNKTTCNIPLSTRFLMTALNLSSSSIQSGLAALKSKQLIEETDSSRIGVSYKVNLAANGALVTPPINDFFTPLDNNIFSITTKCSVSDVLVYLVLYRLSFGFNQNVTTKKVLTSVIAKEVGLSLRRTQDAIRNLLEFSLIKRVSDISSHGIQYRVFLPHEIFPCETKTTVTYEKTKPSTPLSSIDISDTPFSSIDNNKDLTKFSSIDNKISNFVDNQQSLANKALPVDVSLSSTDISATKEILKINKTSSGDADDFLNFIKANLTPQISFLVSKENLVGYISGFGLDTCKKNLLRLKARLTLAANPVGLWINSLKNPQNYPELSQKSEMGRLVEQRLADEQKRREQIQQEQARAAEQKRLADYWQSLSPENQIFFIGKSEDSFRQNTPNRLPPETVIKERAMRMAVEKMGENQ